jgi:hypothetical protein
MDIDLRLTSMQRALTDVIIPALANSHGMAVEQAHFLLFHLQLMAIQFDDDYRFHLLELREIARLTQALLDGPSPESADSSAIRESRELLSRAEPLLTVAVPSRAKLAELTRQLKVAADGLLRRDLDSADLDTRKRITALALDYSKRRVVRERVWVRDAGFDLELAGLPSLEEILQV